jgi:hypothetical protein
MATAREDAPTADSLQGRLWLCGWVSGACYLGLIGSSFCFVTDSGGTPLLIVLGLLVAATLTYFLALSGILPRPAPHPGPPPQGESVTEPCTLRIILGFAVSFRVLLLPSWPIQEIDYYRYLWDGRVVLHGCNPYCYTPWQIDQVASPARGEGTREGCDLPALVELSRQSASVQAIFQGVHYREVPTAYPPLAQGIFALSALLTPSAAPVWAHVVIWKILVLGFDLGTLALLILLLRRLELPEVWCLAYAWCPLVLKEFANSGHFDAIAVFFTMLAVQLLVSLVGSMEGTMAKACLGLAALGLAVLAKSYPVVLLPVAIAWLLAWLRWRALVPAAVFAAVVVAGYLPFVAGGSESPAARPDARPPTDDLAQPHSPGTGLETFLTQWEMNDFLFMLAREQLRQPGAGEPDRWLVLVPSSWREALHQHLVRPTARALDLSPKIDLGFLVTQVVMGLLLFGVCLVFACQTYRHPEALVLVRMVFLTLAWTWLLAAAQFPWYLLWCLPLMVFARQRSWFLLPGLVLWYYFRFWLEGRHGPAATGVFDFGLIWLEYAPFFLALIVESGGQWRIGHPLGEPGMIPAGDGSAA